jgi:hypothetical protein
LKIALIVEGKTEKAFLGPLRDFLSRRLGQQMPKISPQVEHGRIPTEQKLKRVVTWCLDDGADAVIALTDVYTGTREFADADDAKKKMRQWVGDERRFHPHAAQHDFEAWLLPYWDQIRTITGCSRNSPSSGDPERVNHGKPPARYIHEAYRTGTKTKNTRSYIKTIEALAILRGQDLTVAARQCAELRALLNTILALCGAPPLS